MSSLNDDNDGTFGLKKEASKASIASLSRQGSIAHSEAPSRSGSLVVKSSGGNQSEGGGGLLTAPTIKEVMDAAAAAAPPDEITLKADKGGVKPAPTVRSSFGGNGQALVVDLKPTPTPTPLKTPSLRKGPGSELGLDSPFKGSDVNRSEQKSVNLGPGGASRSPSVRSSSARHRSPTKEDRPDATQHIDYDAHADS